MKKQWLRHRKRRSKSVVNIRITVKNVSTGNTWDEDYDKLEVSSENATKWAKNLISWFNQTYRPGESKRKLLKVQVIGQSTEHNWYKRTDGMSVLFRGSVLDIFECSACGVTGKRLFGTSAIKRDHKYKAKKFAVCSRKQVVELDDKIQTKKENVKRA